jgi:hypothetical protein
LSELFTYFETDCGLSDIKFLSGFCKNLKELVIDGLVDRSDPVVADLRKLYDLKN